MLVHNSVSETSAFPLSVPGLRAIPVQEFPEYARDMVQNRENKIEAEYTVCC